jgi:hypothetical protein
MKSSLVKILVVIFLVIGIVSTGIAHVLQVEFGAFPQCL